VSCNVKPKTFDQQVPRTLASFFLFACITNFFVTSNAESNARVNGICELLNLIQVFPSSSQWWQNLFLRRQPISSCLLLRCQIQIYSFFIWSLELFDQLVAMAHKIN